MKSGSLTICFLLFLGISSLMAQKMVQGSIKDADGTPMIGVNIVEEGTINGTISDLDGNFSLEVAGPQSVLLISYTGYAPMRQAVGDASTINLTLEEDVEILDEVVVSALGFTEKKDELGATSSSVRAEDISRSGEAMFLNALGAKASNVQISRSNGDPGAGTTIRIRGANTISGSSNPLIILDGIPISNETVYGGGNDITGGRDAGVSQQSRLNDINPNDIASVQILKGASAASLWGSRAANGVVVITTKSGKAGKPKISYKATRSLDYVQERIPMQTTWGQGSGGNYSPNATEAWGDYIPDRSGGADDVNTSGQYFESATGNLYYPISQKNSRDTYVDENWDAVFQTGGFWQHDLSISGGNERATYFFSLGRLDQEGIIKESDYDRTNLRLNNKFVLSEWMTVNSKVGYTNSNSNRIQQSSNVTGLLLGLLRTPPDFDTRDYIGTYYSNNGEAFFGRHRSYRRYLGGASSNPTYNNPLWTVFEQTATSALSRFTMSQEVNIIPTSWLQLTLRGGVDKNDDKRVYFFPVGSASDRNSGVFAEDLIGEQELNFDAIAKGNFSVSKDVSMTATLGWNINDRKRFINSTQLSGFLVNSDKETTNLNTAAEASQISNSKRFIRSNRGYGVLAFDLFDKLFVTASGAMEAASSVKGTFFYPSFDAAWQFSQKKSDKFSFGKLRGSWGKVGVQPIPHRFETLAESDFSYTTYSDPLNINLWGGGFRVDDDKGNPDLKPEIKTEWELGTDLRFFHDALSLNMTYYQNKIDGILIAVGLTPSSGYDTQYANAAEMENKGFEVELGYDLLKKNDWNINLFANWSTNRNKVLDLEGTETIDLTPGASVSSRAIVGQPLGVLYGTGSQLNPDGSYLLDDNGFPQITTSPQVLGDPNPDWRGGLGFNVSWKSLALNVVVEHSHGGDFSPRTLWVLRRFGTTEETAARTTLSQDLYNYNGDLIPAGTTVRGSVTDFGGGAVLLDESWYRTGIGGGLGDNQAYNFSVFDATLTRIREVSLGYTINSPAFQNRTRLGSVSFTATGRNLFLWDKIEGIDPEINQYGVSSGFGLDYFTNPSTRSLLFSIAISY